MKKTSTLLLTPFLLSGCAAGAAGLALTASNVVTTVASVATGGPDMLPGSQIADALAALNSRGTAECNQKLDRDLEQGGVVMAALEEPQRSVRTDVRPPVLEPHQTPQFLVLDPADARLERTDRPARTPSRRSGTDTVSATPTSEPAEQRGSESITGCFEQAVCLPAQPNPTIMMLCPQATERGTAWRPYQPVNGDPAVQWQWEG